MNNEKRIFPPIYLLISLVAMIGLHFFLPVPRIIPPPYRLLGIVPILLGVGMNWWASSFFNKIGTPVRPFQQSTRFVTEGLYQYTRNPMYLGMVIILAGVAILLGSIIPFFVIPIFIWVIQQHFIRFEEQALQNTFGHEYLEYKKRVRRWI